jgi:hypothetical protein
MAELSRRGFLQAGAAGVLSRSLASADEPSRHVKRVAAINSVYRKSSHAYHIAGRFLHGYSIEGFHHQPPFKLVRMLNDQSPANDLSPELARRFGFERCRTVAEALGGATGLDVDAVLLIIEHGDYPTNEVGQILYPRHRLFMEVVEVFRRSKRAVPVFCDKHLSYHHKLAAEMVAAARRLGFGLMAGSSLPVTWRRPDLDPPLGTPFTEALVCHPGGIEVYGFHGLETLQCLMERRAPAETGVRAVTCLRGPAVWKAGDAGLWSWELLEAALARSPTRDIGGVRDNASDPVAILVEYRDGARGAALNLTGHVSDITFAARLKGRRQPVSTLFDLPAAPGANYFNALVYNIEKLFATGVSPYPVERTLLTSTVLDFSMHSLAAGGKRLEDPALHVGYKPAASSGHFRGRETDE